MLSSFWWEKGTLDKVDAHGGRTVEWVLFVSHSLRHLLMVLLGDTQAQSCRDGLNDSIAADLKVFELLGQPRGE